MSSTIKVTVKPSANMIANHFRQITVREFMVANLPRLEPEDSSLTTFQRISSERGFIGFNYELGGGRLKAMQEHLLTIQLIYKWQSCYRWILYSSQKIPRNNEGSTKGKDLKVQYETLQQDNYHKIYCKTMRNVQFIWRLSKFAPMSLIPTYKFFQENLLSSSIVHLQRKDLTEENKMNALSQKLKGQFDTYNSIHIDPAAIESYVSNPLEFQSVLQSCLKEWRQNNVKAIWLKISTAQLGLAQTVISCGFEMHHCSKDFIVFSQWLLNDEPSRLPHYCTHFIGAGGLILNENNEILMVQEKNGNRKGLWGIPGGLVDEGELVADAAKREVLEETGLDAEPYDMLLFREVLFTKFDKADLYFVVLMKLKDKNQPITLCEKELSDHRWVSIDKLQEVDFMKVTQFMTNNHVGPTQIELFDVLTQLRKDNVPLDKKFFDVKSTVKDFYGKARKFAVYRPHL